MAKTYGLCALLLAAAVAHGCAHGRSQQAGSAPTADSATSTAPSARASTPAEKLPIETQELSYGPGPSQFKGFLAYPAGVSDKRPGVLVVHEWWGLNDYVRSRARMLAELGYVALAIDMYGEGKSTEHPADAKKFASEATSSQDEAARRFEAGRQALLGDPRVDGERTAAIGYCFGGAVVLGAARRGADFDVIASFHGNYATQTPMAKDAFQGKLFIAHGAADSFVPPEQVAALKSELDRAGAQYEFVAYEGAKHGFTNPAATALGQKAGIDVAYDPEADSRSWAKLTALLAQAFGGS